jgi:hypothetical protein
MVASDLVASIKSGGGDDSVGTSDSSKAFNDNVGMLWIAAGAAAVLVAFALLRRKR